MIHFITGYGEQTGPYTLACNELAAPRVLYVSSLTGSDAEGYGLTRTKPAASLGYLIGGGLATGDVIIFLAGHFESADTQLSTSVCIIGEGSDGDVPRAGFEFTSGTDNLLLVEAPDVELRNLLFKARQTGSHFPLLAVQADRTWVEDCYFEASANDLAAAVQFGELLDSSGDPVEANCWTFIRNVVRFHGTTQARYGITARTGRSQRMEENVIEGPWEAAVYFTPSETTDRLEVVNNTIKHGDVVIDTSSDDGAAILAGNVMERSQLLVVDPDGSSAISHYPNGLGLTGHPYISATDLTLVNVPVLWVDSTTTSTARTGTRIDPFLTILEAATTAYGDDVDHALVVVPDGHTETGALTTPGVAVMVCADGSGAEVTSPADTFAYWPTYGSVDNVRVVENAVAYSGPTIVTTAFCRLSDVTITAPTRSYAFYGTYAVAVDCTFSAGAYAVGVPNMSRFVGCEFSTTWDSLYVADETDPPSLVTGVVNTDAGMVFENCTISSVAYVPLQASRWAGGSRVEGSYFTNGLN